MERDRNPVRLLELYCGIGGCSVALANRVETVGAIDVNRLAASVYEHNLPLEVSIADLRSIAVSRLSELKADLWWLSPPCQPFTRRGKRRDDADPRAESFLALFPVVESVRPRHLALENVPGFQGSRTHARWLETLDNAGYEYREFLVCPHTLGWPNRRERYYLVASLDGLRTLPSLQVAERIPLASFIDSSADQNPELRVSTALLSRYRGALDIAEREDPNAVTATFTSAYGRSHVRSGSYLRTESGARRFSPREILRLLGFPEAYTLPPGLPLMNAWRLVGNSLSLPAVRRVLGCLDLGEVRS